MRNVLRTFAILAVVAAAGACSDDEPNGPEPVARLRFLHAMPATGAVGVKWGSETVLSSASYGSSSAAYQEIDAGQRTLAARLASATSDLATRALTVESNRSHTALLVKANNAASIAVLSDTNTAPAAGKAKLRVVHAAASVTGNLDAYVTAPNADITNVSPTDAAVQPGKAGLYRELAAGSWQVRFTTAGTKTVVLDAGNVTLAAGQVRTMVALDAAAGGTPLQAVTLQDRNP